jgi:hypothetical protein
MLAANRQRANVSGRGERSHKEGSMKGKLFAGALALSLFGGVAMAQSTVNDPAYKPEERSVMRGVMVTAGAGFEGYTGGLRSELSPGVTWGATAAIKPTKIIGLELGYSGAANELRNGVFDVSGADLVRNGGQLVATVGLGAAPVQPYLLGGVGINWYNARAVGSGFGDDTAGVVPLGGGVRAHIGHFTADARLNYDLLFSQDMANRVGLETTASNLSGLGGGAYRGTLNIGSTF